MPDRPAEQARATVRATERAARETYQDSSTGDGKDDTTSGDGKDDTTSGAETGNDGGMTYGEYLDKYYGGDAAEKNFDNAIDSAETDYARAKATYGQKAETLGRMGLTGSGYGDYLEGLAYSEMQGAKQNAALTRDKQKAEQQRSYGEYLENKKNTLSQNYQNWLVTSANKTYDLDTMKGMLAEQVKNGDLTQAQADAIIGNYGKGSDAGSEEQRPAILSKLTAQIMDAGLTDEAKIRAAIAAYQGAYGVTLTEDEIAGIISNIQGITGKGNTGIGTDADGETPPSETVAAAYNALLSTDANGSLIYGSASDEYLKHLLINSGYEAADAEEAIKRFRKTVESGKTESVDQAIKNAENSLTFGMANQLIQSGGYSFDSDEAKEIMSKIQEKNALLIDKLLTSNFNFSDDLIKQMTSGFSSQIEGWGEMSDTQKMTAIKDVVLSDKDFSNETKDNVLNAYYSERLRAIDAQSDGNGKLRDCCNVLVDLENDYQKAENDYQFNGKAFNSVKKKIYSKLNFDMALTSVGRGFPSLLVSWKNGTQDGCRIDFSIKSPRFSNEEKAYYYNLASKYENGGYKFGTYGGDALIFPSSGFFGGAGVKVAYPKEGNGYSADQVKILLDLYIDALNYEW